jgi:hypothetical protein
LGTVKNQPVKMGKIKNLANALANTLDNIDNSGTVELMPWWQADSG